MSRKIRPLKPMNPSRQGTDMSRDERGEYADLIIKGGLVITMAEGQTPIQDATIFIKDGRIEAICGPNDEAPPLGPRVKVIDAVNCIVMPGLINAHTHVAMTLFRGLADDLPLKTWLFEKIFPAEARYLNPETVYWGSLLGCLEMIVSGTTCFADGYFFEDEVVRASLKSGLRGVIAQGVIDLPAPGVLDPKTNLKTARDFMERWAGHSELITPSIFCHSPMTCSAKTLIDSCGIANEFNVPLQIHLSETAEEVDEIVRKSGKRPVQYLKQLGILSDKLIAAHAVHLDDEEIECIRDMDMRIVHVPESNMKLCSGVARIPEMLRLGLRPGLGTDGCSSNNNLDLFQEMDSAAKLAKVMYQDPTSLDAKTVVKMANTWGAAVLGLERLIGTLEVGKRADVIVVDLNRPHLCPIYEPLSALVYSASGSDVKDVVVDGKILMKDRRLMTLDEEEVIQRVKEISKKIRG